MALLVSATLAACSYGGGTDRCADKVCDSPPADTCKDSNTLLVHAQTGACDPASGTCTYNITERNCPYGCEAGRCKPSPTGDLELVIPEGTGLCTLWGWGGDSVMFNWEGKARVTLNAGNIVFPKDQPEVDADPIALVEAWPGASAVPVAPSRFIRTIEEQGGIELHTYEFVQSFTIDQRAIDIVLRVEYEFEGGQPNNPVVVLDDPTLFGLVNYSGAYFEEWKQITLIGCHFEYLEERVRTILVNNGDRITFTAHGREEEFTWPQPSMVFNFELTGVRFERGVEERVVTDFFDLSSSMNHHGCCPGYLAHFDQPVGDVHLIWIDEFSYGRNVQYMDGSGQEIGSLPYTDVP
jgi:hypothetical protein